MWIRPAKNQIIIRMFCLLLIKTQKNRHIISFLLPLFLDSNALCISAWRRQFRFRNRERKTIGHLFCGQKSTVAMTKMKNVYQWRENKRHEHNSIHNCGMFLRSYWSTQPTVMMRTKFICFSRAIHWKSVHSNRSLF